MTPIDVMQGDDVWLKYSRMGSAILAGLLAGNQIFESNMKLYSGEAAKGLSLDDLCVHLRANGAKRVIYKNLAPNDNAKNQPYLGGSFSDLGFLPTGELAPSASTSTKPGADKRSVKFTASLAWFWISPDGSTHQAPNTKLIYYPQYPEVRLSGFSQGSHIDLDGWMDPEKNGRSEGRVLVMGLTESKILAYLALPDSMIAQEIKERPYFNISSVLCELSLDGTAAARNDRIALLHELKRIHLLGYIPSKRLDRDGNIIRYEAKNGGGYTLEAELGIIPNGIAEPDYHGWEVKQFAVSKFSLIDSKALTLMTPEPDGGIYKTRGIVDFIVKYGHKSSESRYDFTGIHKVGETQSGTGLTIELNGFDKYSGKLVDAGGAICLVDQADNVVASWSFAKLIDHWKRKHARAAYIPSLSTDLDNGTRAYHYGNIVRLFQGSDINKLLKQMSDGVVYYDPGIKVENIDTRPKPKLRNQIRIKSRNLGALYNECETVDLLDT